MSCMFGTFYVDPTMEHYFIKYCFQKGNNKDCYITQTSTNIKQI